MVSATATATLAAAGFSDNGSASSLSSKRASTATTASSSLQTPGSGTFPSELRSPMVASPSFLKREPDLRTPITPPSAYLDFLKQMSPAIASPAPTSASARFSFNEKMPNERSCEMASAQAAEPTSQPALSRNSSYESNQSFTSNTSSSSDRTSVSQSSAANSSTSRTRPESPRILIPPSPFARPSHPRSARTPRRLSIPQSPFSPGQSAASPYQTTPLSAAPWSASFASPVDGELNTKSGKVSVRQVVTRTVTYCRTPLEPAPRGKRRKIEIQGPHIESDHVSTKLEPEDVIASTRPNQTIAPEAGLPAAQSAGSKPVDATTIAAPLAPTVTEVA